MKIVRDQEQVLSYKKKRASMHRKKDMFDIMYEAQRTIRDFSEKASSNLTSFLVLFYSTNSALWYFLFASFCNAILYE